MQGKEVAAMLVIASMYFVFNSALMVSGYLRLVAKIKPSFNGRKKSEQRS
jgi:hypothetical protein